MNLRREGIGVRDDASEILAARLGIDATDFVETFGAGWTPVVTTAAGGLGASDDDGSDWYAAGNPTQLMLDLGSNGPRTARPRGTWQGPGALVLIPVDVQPIGDLMDARPELARVLAAHLRKRRATFRYCRLCYQVTPPEYLEGDACMSCQERWRGVVHV